MQTNMSVSSQLSPTCLRLYCVSLIKRYLEEVVSERNSIWARRRSIDICQFCRSNHSFCCRWAFQFSSLWGKIDSRFSEKFMFNWSHLLNGFNLEYRQFYFKWLYFIFDCGFKVIFLMERYILKHSPADGKLLRMVYNIFFPSFSVLLMNFVHSHLWMVSEFSVNINSIYTHIQSDWKKVFRLIRNAMCGTPFKRILLVAGLEKPIRLGWINLELIYL